jgi:hypothetical protein
VAGRDTTLPGRSVLAEAADAEGNVVQAWGGPGPGHDWFGSEHGIYLDSKGFVWLGGNGPQDGMILKYARDGRFVMQIRHEGPLKASNDTTQLGRPADTGAFKRLWGAYGHRPADEKLSYDPKASPARQFGNPVHCVKIARAGLVYVCDRQNGRIQVFHKDGRFVGEWFYETITLGAGSVWDLAIWPDKAQSFLFNADGENNEVRILKRTDGTVLGAFGGPGRQAGQFHWVHNIAVDSRGNVFTTEVDNAKRVQRFVPVNGGL